MWPAKLLLFLLAAACVSLDLAVWASYPQPRTQFPVALLALLISQTTLLTLWAVYGQGWLWLRVPVLLAMLVVLTAVGDRLQLWGPRDSMRLFDALVLVIGGKLAVVAGALVLFSASLKLRLMRPENPSPSGRGSVRQAMRAKLLTEPSAMPTALSGHAIGDSLAKGVDKMAVAGSASGRHSSAFPTDAEASPLQTCATERFVIEQPARSSHQFSLTWLFSLMTAVALSLMLLRFVPMQLPRDEQTLHSMLGSVMLFAIIDGLCLWGVLSSKLRWPRLVAIAAGIYVFRVVVGALDHPLAIDGVELATLSAIPLTVSLAVVRVCGFRWQFGR